MIAIETVESRRAFGAVIFGGVVGLVYQLLPLFERKYGLVSEKGKLLDMLATKDDPEIIAEKFVRADSATLMCMYAVFWPQLLERFWQWDEKIIERIRDAAQNEKKRYKLDPHRLDALPALTAAHCLGWAVNASAREALSIEVARGLYDPRREALEMLCQNLITSLTPTYEVGQYYDIGQDPLQAGAELIERAKNTDKLLSPLCLYCQFLAGLKVIFSNRGYETPSLRVVNQQLELIKSTPIPHFWYAKQLVQLYESKITTVDYTKEFPLPPESSELLIGWRKYVHSTKMVDLAAHLALIRARLTFSIYETVSGRDTTYLQVMNREEAGRAYEKSISFSNTFGVDELLRLARWDQLPLPQEESRFKEFLSRDFPNELRTAHVSPEIDEATRKGGYLKAHVPFSSLCPDNVPRSLAEAASRQKRRFWKEFFKRIPKSTQAGLTAAAAYQLFEEQLPLLLPVLSQLLFGRPLMPQEEQELMVERKAMEGEVFKNFQDFDERLGEALEAKQARLGQLKIARPKWTG